MSINEHDMHLTGAWLRTSLERMLNTIDYEEAHPSLPYGLKRCSTCGQVKDFSEFFRFHRSRDGRLGRCKSCFLTKRGGQLRERAGGKVGKIGSPVRNEVELLEDLETTGGVLGMSERIVLEWDEARWAPGVAQQVFDIILRALEVERRTLPDSWVNETLVGNESA